MCHPTQPRLLILGLLGAALFAAAYGQAPLYYSNQNQYFLHGLASAALGLDYPWYLQAGVAGQYVLGGMLQPSVFGVLLVVAVCLFARDRPASAVVCVALAVAVHSTYLLPAGLLTLGFLAALVREGRG